jgi:ribosomal protein S18 acetylase RimI-like enzyme
MTNAAGLRHCRVWHARLGLSRGRNRLAEKDCTKRVDAVLTCQDFRVNSYQAGAINLAEFVRATAGRNGAHCDVLEAVCVASPVPVPNGYVNAVMPVDTVTQPSALLDQACKFFGGHNRPFVLWAPPESALSEDASRRGKRSKDSLAPAMVTRTRVANQNSSLRIELVTDSAAGLVLADVAERGYETPGFSYVLQQHNSWSEPKCLWALAFDGDIAVSVACGFLHNETGGIYVVATPPEHRGHGFAAALTAWLTNELFARGALTVTLQASAMGFGVYERLGFDVYGHYERFIVEPN